MPAQRSLAFADARPRQAAPPLRVLLVHPQAIARVGLRRLLETHGGFRVVAEAATAEQALEQVRRCHPALVVADLTLSSPGVLELIAALARSGGPAVVVLADGSQPWLLADALRAGARGVLPRDVAAAELPVMLRLLACAEASSPTRAPAARVAPHSLSARQRQLLACIGRGYSNRRIAAELRLSVHTVKHHLSRLFDRVGVGSRLELMRLVRGERPPTGRDAAALKPAPAAPASPLRDARSPAGVLQNTPLRRPDAPGGRSGSLTGSPRSREPL
jgi:two-component system response regulator NreC